MFKTEATANGHTRWPRAFDARLAERIVEEFVPMIEAEAREVRGAVVRMGDTLVFEWAHGQSWGRVVGIGSTSMEPGTYTVTVERQGPPIESEP